MAIDPAPKDYTLIIYNKDEIDATNAAETLRVDNELAARANINDFGSPSGIATLDDTAKHKVEQVRFATRAELADETNLTGVMNPEGTHYLLSANGYQDKDANDLIYGNVKSDGSIPMEVQYLPQAQTDIATVKYVQDYASSNTTTYIRNTIAEMYLITPIVVGDVCFVVADGANDGEYIALSASTGGSVSGDWAERTTQVVWGTITGDLTAQTDVQLALALKTDITETHAITTKTDFITVTQAVDLDTMETDIATNTGDTSTNTGAIGVLSSLDTTVKTDLVSATNEQEARLDQMDTLNTNQGTAINTNGINIAELQSPDSTAYTPQVTPPTYAEGTLFYDDPSHTFVGYDDISGTSMNFGAELGTRVINKSGATIPNGKPLVQVDVDAATDLPMVEMAQADTIINANIIGFSTHEILDGAQGRMTTYGTISGLNTSAFIDGDTLYVSETVQGEMVVSPPSIVSRVGKVLIADNAIGKILLSIDANASLPTYTAFMRGGGGTATLAAGAYQTMTNYTSSGSAVLAFDVAAGTITVPTTGIYRAVIGIALKFDTIGNSEEDFTVRLVGSVAGSTDLLTGVSRNSGFASAYPTVSFSATAGEVFRVDIACTSDTLTNVVYSYVAFSIDAVNVAG